MFHQVFGTGGVGAGKHTLRTCRGTPKFWGILGSGGASGSLNFNIGGASLKLLINKNKYMLNWNSSLCNVNNPVTVQRYWGCIVCSPVLTFLIFIHAQQPAFRDFIKAFKTGVYCFYFIGVKGCVFHTVNGGFAPNIQDNREFFTGF